MDSHLFKQLFQQEEEAKHENIRKKEYEAALSAAERKLRDELTATARMQQNVEASFRLHADSRAKLEIAQMRSLARIKQLDTAHLNIEELQSRVGIDIWEVWKKREEFCEASMALSDQCDIPALFATRAHAQLVPTTVSASILPPTSRDPADRTAADRLQTAQERRLALVVERDRLRVEPEKGDEFVRKFLQRNKINYRNFSAKVEEESISNAPFKFSTSPAATRKPVIVRNPQYREVPWYQPIIVSGSAAVFLIYFLVLREANDMDAEFDKTLYDRIQGLEKQQLLQSYRFNIENGKSVEGIEKRLKEIEQEEAAVAAAKSQ